MSQIFVWVSVIISSLASCRHCFRLTLLTIFEVQVPAILNLKFTAGRAFKFNLIFGFKS
jgi:hypothetical protein